MRLVSRRLLTAGTALALAHTAGCGEDTVDPTPRPPAAPAGLTATVQSPTLIRVSWTAVAGATSYRLERADAFLGIGLSPARQRQLIPFGGVMQ